MKFSRFTLYCLFAGTSHQRWPSPYKCAYILNICPFEFWWNVWIWGGGTPLFENVPVFVRAMNRDCTLYDWFTGLHPSIVRQIFCQCIEIQWGFSSSDEPSCDKRLRVLKSSFVATDTAIWAYETTAAQSCPYCKVCTSICDMLYKVDSEDIQINWTDFTCYFICFWS